MAKDNKDKETDMTFKYSDTMRQGKYSSSYFSSFSYLHTKINAGNCSHLTNSVFECLRLENTIFFSHFICTQGYKRPKKKHIYLIIMREWAGTRIFW